MKKIFVKPELNTMNMEVETSILAGSVTQITNQYSNGTQLSRSAGNGNAAAGAPAVKQDISALELN